MKASSQKVIDRNRSNALKRFIDMTGIKYGFLTAIQRVEMPCRETMWKLKCDCGNETIANGSHVRSGRIKSCGCYVLKVNADRMRGNDLGLKHGLTNHPLRGIRKAMMHRCCNHNNKFYKNYGARGISVCQEWTDSLECFYEWAMKSGWEKGLSIDRINNDGNYTPENCRWITISENSRRNANKLWEGGMWNQKKK